jgi:hypothetical protein
MDRAADSQYACLSILRFTGCVGGRRSVLQFTNHKCIVGAEFGSLAYVFLRDLVWDYGVYHIHSGHYHVQELASQNLRDLASENFPQIFRPFVHFDCAASKSRRFTSIEPFFVIYQLTSVVWSVSCCCHLDYHFERNYIEGGVKYDYEIHQVTDVGVAHDLAESVFH